MKNDESELREIESILPKENTFSGLAAILILLVLALLFEDVTNKTVLILVSVLLIIIGVPLTFFKKMKEKGFRNG